MAPSTQEWNQDLVCPDPGDHIVHLYFRKQELARAVAYYAATGFELGEAVVLVMKPEHWRATREELERRVGECWEWISALRTSGDESPHAAG